MKLTPYQSIFYREWLQNPLRSDYNVVMDNIVVGELNCERKKETLLKLLNEHLIFRFTVENRESSFYEKKKDETKEIIIYHPHNLSNDEIKEIISEPFNLEKDIFFRLHIIKLREQKYRIICVLPPWVSDGIKREHGILKGESLLLPIQEWFFSILEKGKLPCYDHWNQACMIKVPELDINIIKQSLNLLSQYHDSLRLVFREGNLSYYQQYEKQIDIPLDTLNVKGLSEKEIEDELTSWQSQFDIFYGPLFHVGYLKGFKDGNDRMHLAAHHLIVDAVSWGIIVNDFNRIYDYLSTHTQETDTAIEVILGSKGSSYLQWTQAISEYLKKDQKSLKNEFDYWKSVTLGIKENNSILLKQKTDQYYRTEFTLDINQTDSLLSKVHHVYNTQVNDILLTAFCKSLSGITGRTENHILWEGEGRESIFPELDINNTVGWFTSIFPVKLSSSEKDQEKLLVSVKDTLRRIPNNGMGYGPLIGYKVELPLVAFNYLRPYDQTGNISNASWSFCNENVGLTIARSNEETNILNVKGSLIGGQLSFIIEGYLSSMQIENLSRSFKQNLEKLIAALITKKRSYKTLSDIDFIIGQKYLDHIQAEEEIEKVYLANSLHKEFIYHALRIGNIDDIYHTQLLWNYQTSLEVEKLKQAIQLTQEKFETLRLRLAWEEEPVRIINKKNELNWEYEDISGLNELAQNLYIENVIGLDKAYPFKLNIGCLFRVYLLKRSEEYYTCIFTYHSAILDGQSDSVIINDIQDNYLRLVMHTSQKPCQISAVQEIKTNDLCLLDEAVIH